MGEIIGVNIGRKLEFGWLGRVGGGVRAVEIVGLGGWVIGIPFYSNFNLVNKPWLYDILLIFLEETLISVFKSDTIIIIILMGACNAEGNIRPNSYAPQNFALLQYYTI